ncbi:hypothetical protein [Rathayibacter soli]|uniref:hypothetical protein n=1 Tax=Rathayibacter soli TaxID=3144168 RepID=UPI0027E51571|nr:hypothetical protein [Glaciibacter superstes]
MTTVRDPAAPATSALTRAGTGAATRALGTNDPARSPLGSRSRGGLFLTVQKRRTVAIVRIAFGLIWAVDAGLKWLPSFAQHTLLAKLSEVGDGQPAPVHAWIDSWTRLVATDPRAFAILLALAESLIAIGLLTGSLTNAVCSAGAVLSMTIWTTGEGFGGPYGDGATDVGASPAYVIAFALLGVVGAGGAWGFDRWLHSKLGRMAWLSSRPA